MLRSCLFFWFRVANKVRVAAHDKLVLLAAFLLVVLIRVPDFLIILVLVVLIRVPDFLNILVALRRVLALRMRMRLGSGAIIGSCIQPIGSAASAGCHFFANTSMPPKLCWTWLLMILALRHTVVPH